MLFYSDTISNNHYHFEHKSQTHNSNSMAIIKWIEIKQMLLTSKFIHFLSVKLTTSNWIFCSFENVRRIKNENSYFRKSKTCRLLDIHIVIVASAHTWILTSYKAVEKRFKIQCNVYITMKDFIRYENSFINFHMIYLLGISNLKRRIFGYFFIQHKFIFR